MPLEAMVSRKNWTAAGTAGFATANVTANFQAMVGAYAPIDQLIIQLGRNEINAAVVQGDATTLIRLCQVFAPKIIWVGGVWWGSENWAAGPVWADFPAGEAVNVAISAACTATGATYCDARAGVLPLEVTANPGHAINGILTDDGTHPNATGKTTMSTVVATAVTAVFG